MANKRKIIAVDLDDTLCTRSSGKEHLGIEKYNYCSPINENIKLVNALFDQGHDIYIYTARGMKTCNMDVSLVYSKYYEFTNKQLKDWGIKYNRLVMGKQYFDFLLDDKAISLREKNILSSLLD